MLLKKDKTFTDFWALFSVPYLDHLGLSCSAFQWAPKVLYVYATASCNRVIGSLSRVDFPAQGLGYSRVSPEACAKI